MAQEFPDDGKSRPLPAPHRVDRARMRQGHARASWRTACGICVDQVLVGDKVLRGDLYGAPVIPEREFRWSATSDLGSDSAERAPWR